MQAEKGFIKLVTDNNFYTITSFGLNGSKTMSFSPNCVNLNEVKTLIKNQKSIDQFLESIGYIDENWSHMPNGMFLRNNGWDVLF